VIEVAALELMGDLPTGKHFHRLIHPERDIPEGATRVHGITIDKLRDAPRFEEVMEEMLAFFGDGPLIAHNAPFDFGFLNAELTRAKGPQLHPNRMVDTLVLAKGPLPRHAEQPGRAMPPLRHRPVRAHHPQRPCWIAACWPRCMWS